MTRHQLIDKLARRFPHLTHDDVEISVKAILNETANHLASGGRIEIRGFGAFSVNTRLPRWARNPKTGERVEVSAKAVPHFKPGLELRSRVNR